MYEHDDSEGSRAGLVNLIEVIIGALVGLGVLLGAILGLVWFFLHSTAAHAEEAPGAPPAGAACGPLVQVAAALKERAHEEEISFGIIDNKSALIIFASPKGETWTAVIAGATGLGCMIASGRDFYTGQVLKGDPV